MRYLSARERALRTVVAKLKTIQEANDYNFSIKHVRRNRTIMETEVDPPSLCLMFGRNKISYRNANGAEIWNELPVQIWAYVVDYNKSDDYGPDTVSNMILSDVQRALACETVYDTSGHLPPGMPLGREIQCTCIDDEPLYSETDDGQIVVRMFYTVRYSYLESDPRLYDDCDEKVPLLYP